MAQQPHMAMGGMAGGPVQRNPMMNAGGAATPTAGSNASGSDQNAEIRSLNTYIYDYFIKNDHLECARAILNTNLVNVDTKGSPGNVNGAPNGMTGKNIKAEDLPAPSLPADIPERSFLIDWWAQFWDVYQAHSSQGYGSNAARKYLNQSQRQQQMSQENQQRMLRQVDPAAMNNNMQYQQMMRNAPMTEAQRQAMMNGKMPGHLAQMQLQRAMVTKQMANNQMNRGGALGPDQNAPVSPGQADNAPSPKRPRLDGQMGPGGRGQPLSQQVYSQDMAEQMKNAIASNLAKGMQPGGNQGSPMPNQQNADADMNYYAGPNRPNGMPGQGNGQAQSGNHALQDYQMQLMLLEQQNKKRLMMARQEQDSSIQGPGAGPGAGPNGPGQQGFPQGFDPAQMQQMGQQQPQFVQGPNGQMMMRPPNAHPGAFPQGMTPDMQAALAQQQQQQQQQQGQQGANGLRMPNGQFPPGGPPNGMQPGQGQPGQPPQNAGTPQQRNAVMPPPPPPTGTEANRTQPSSPSQQAAAPPTPSQAKKAKPPAKKDAKKAGPPAKKGGNNANTAENEPATPNSATPQTPRNAGNNAGPQANGAGAAAGGPAAGQGGLENSSAPAPPMGQQNDGGMGNIAASFGKDSESMNFPLTNGEDGANNELVDMDLMTMDGGLGDNLALPDGMNDGFNFDFEQAFAFGDYESTDLGVQ